MTILIVEDNPTNAKLLRILLTGRGYQTIVADDGVEALKICAAMPDIDLIITDYLMPNMDGPTFIEQVRRLPAFQKTPILVASAQGDLSTIKQVKALQCEGFLVKPIDATQLLIRIKSLLRSRLSSPFNRQATMDALQIGLAEYDDLVKAFTVQLNDTMTNVTLESEFSETPISTYLSRLLKTLADKATLLGADEFTQRMTPSLPPALPTRAQCADLLETLRQLDVSIRSASDV